MNGRAASTTALGSDRLRTMDPLAGPFRSCLRGGMLLLGLSLLLIPELLWAREGSVRPKAGVRSCFQDPAALYPGRSAYWLLQDHEDPARYGAVQLATRGSFQLQRQGGHVDATVIVDHTTATPSRTPGADPGAEASPVLFTVPAGYRPLHTMVRWVEARSVREDGSLWRLPELTGTWLALELQVDPLGAVRYRDVTKVAALVKNHWGTDGDRWGFALDATWVTATSVRQGRYDHPRETRSHYQLRRQNETVAATLTGLASPVPGLSEAHGVLFTLPQGYRPSISLTREVEAWPVRADGSLQEAQSLWQPVQLFTGAGNHFFTKVADPRGRQRWEPYRFTLRIARDGTVRYGDRPAWDGVAHLNYTLTTSWTTSDTHWPLTVATGPYDQPAVHQEGRYRLQREGDRVAAVLTAKRSPLSHPDVLFTIPPDYRPATTVIREIVGQDVPVEGGASVPPARRFRVQVDPAGTVRYASQAAGTDPGYVAYVLQTTWGTTPLAGDRLALEALHAHNQEGFGLKPNWNDVIVQYPLTAASGQMRDPLWLRHDVPLGEWRGVTTNAEGRVTALDLYGLGGRLPAQLGDLTALRALTVTWHYLYSRSLTGSLPAALGQLEALQELRIEGDAVGGEGLQGSIPPALGQLARLRVLDLSGQALQGSIPPTLGQLTDLRILDLRSNDLQGPIPPALGQLTDLRILDLASNDLQGSIPPALGLLTALQRLSLSDNDLMGPIPGELGQLSQLQNVHLGRNDLTGCVPTAWQPRRFFVRSGPYGEEKTLPFCPP